MKMLVLHDREGNIASVLTGPAGAPKCAPVRETEQLLSEVEVPESLLGADDDPDSELTGLVRLIKGYVVKLDQEAQLVRRGDATSIE